MNVRWSSINTSTKGEMKSFNIEPAWRLTWIKLLCISSTRSFPQQQLLKAPSPRNSPLQPTNKHKMFYPFKQRERMVKRNFVQAKSSLHLTILQTHYRIFSPLVSNSTDLQQSIYLRRERACQRSHGLHYINS